MSSPSETVTPTLLREWALPSAGDDKYGRGRVVVVGGARKTPGAAMLAGLAALRVGAGHMTLAVAESVAVQMAVAVPEFGVIGLRETPSGSVRGDAGSELADAVAGADAVLVGPGLDDPDQAAALLQNLAEMLGQETQLVLDAYALGVLPGLPQMYEPLRGRLVLTPNSGEAERLLGTELGDLEDDVSTLADRFGAAVTCDNAIADMDGRQWLVSTGHVGLASSGSGDVLAGAVTGLLARGAGRGQAACWGTHLHASAGDRLAARVGPLGFLARELLDELPLELVQLHA